MKVLVAGPDTLEYGWLLMRWQGAVRHRSRSYDKTIVICKKEHVYLYEDFTQDFILYESNIQPNCWKIDNPPDPRIICGGLVADYMIPSKEECEGEIKQEFIKYSYLKHTKKDCICGKCSEKTGIMFHIRNRLDTKERNWDIKKWEELAVQLIAHDPMIQIATVGSKEQALDLGSYAVDMRGMDLDMLIANMEVAKLIVGPSSAPHHLASLCGLKSIVWTDNKLWHIGERKGTNRERYERIWNPLNTPVNVIDHEGWNPSVETVFNAIKGELKCS